VRFVGLYCVTVQLAWECAR